MSKIPFSEELSEHDDSISDIKLWVEDKKIKKANENLEKKGLINSMRESMLETITKKEEELNTQDYLLDSVDEYSKDYDLKLLEEISTLVKYGNFKI